MGPNPSFKFVKNMLKDSPKVNYSEHLLSSSSSLKNKKVLANHGGGKIEEKWVKSLENIMATNLMSHYTHSIHPKSALVIVTLCLVISH